MSKDLSDVIGRVLPAPENFLSADQLEQARKARRSFMGKALAMGAGAVAAAGASTHALAAGAEGELKGQLSLRVSRVFHGDQAGVGDVPNIFK